MQGLLAHALTLSRLSLALLAAASWPSTGQTASTLGGAAVPATASAWEVETVWRAGLGWKDNVLLSPVARDSGGFFRGEIEALAWRPSDGRWEGLAFLDGDVTRYLDAPVGVGGEQEWYGHGEWRWEAGPRLKVIGTGQGYFQDQVFDLSATAAQREVARLRVEGALGGLEVRWALPGQMTLAAFGGLHRSDYRAYDEDFTERRIGARLHWGPRSGMSIGLRVQERRRDFDDRLQYSLFGLPRAGLRLSFRRPEVDVEGEWRSGAWLVQVAGHLLANRDGGSGYFDYAERGARTAVTWERGRWKLAAEAQSANLVYRVQRVGFGFAPPQRKRTDIDVSWRGERRLGEAWLVFADWHRELSRGNEEEISYRVASIAAGLGRTF